MLTLGMAWWYTPGLLAVLVVLVVALVIIRKKRQG